MPPLYFFLHFSFLYLTWESVANKLKNNNDTNDDDGTKTAI